MLRHRRPSSFKSPSARRRPARLIEDEDPEDWIIDGPGDDKDATANAPATG
jgi:hypothetical protein